MPSMRLLPKAFLLLAVGLVFSMPLFSAEDEGGKNLAQRVYDRPDGSDVATRAVMVLAEQGHSPRRRTLYTYAMDRGGGERWSLTRFTEPADINGTGLLTLDYPGDESDQWLYLPALDRVRRIASSRKGGRFVGSDLFYEDLRDREVDMDHHRLSGKGEAGGQECDILISTPVDPDNSVYSRRKSWVHPRTLIPLQVEYFQNGSEKPVKRMKVRKIKKIQGFWTVLDSVMYDLESGHSTRLVTTAIKYDQGLPAELFSKQALADDSRERAFRP